MGSPDPKMHKKQMKELENYFKAVQLWDGNEGKKAYRQKS